MSENRNRGIRDFSEYDAMTTEELEEILRLDAAAPEGGESDTELLLYVMEVLVNRRNNANVTGKTALEAWESFQQRYLPPEEECLEYTPEQRSEKPSASWLRRLIAAAAVIALVVCIPVAANAFGWGDMWQTVARWAKETFSFVSGEEVEISEPAPDDSLEYESLQDALNKNGIEAQLVPTWIPDGYEQDKIETYISPAQEIYIAYFTDDDKELKIRVESYLQGDPKKVEINDELLEIYEVSEVQYYIFFNMDQIRAVWIVDNHECNISGDLSLDEVKEMIDSIGKG